MNKDRILHAVVLGVGACVHKLKLSGEDMQMLAEHIAPEIEKVLLEEANANFAEASLVASSRLADFLSTVEKLDSAVKGPGIVDEL